MTQFSDSPVKMVITDLDGTLLNSNSNVSEQDINTLKQLGELEIKRVIATGRSFFSLRRVLPADFPLDYLISASGAGIMDWQTKSSLYSAAIPADQVMLLASDFIKRKFDFMIQEPLPENHRFIYHQSGNVNPDFQRRIDHYQDHADLLMNIDQAMRPASVLIVIIPSDIGLYEKLKSEYPQFNVIRTTSPLDHVSMWIEFFPKNVSKSDAARHLCSITSCDYCEVVSIGNDYNDLDLLDWSRLSFVVANAPADIKRFFPTVFSNDQSGFTEAVLQAIPEFKTNKKEKLIR